MNPILSVFADVLKRQRVNPDDLPTCRKCTAFVTVTDMGPLGFGGVHCAPRLCEDCWNADEAGRLFAEDAKRFRDLCGRLDVPVGFKPIRLADLHDTPDMAAWRPVFQQYINAWPLNRETGQGFVISSAKTGNGKTTTAMAIATEAQAQRAHVLFIRSEHYREAMADSKRRNEVRSVLAMADLFVLDDLGTEKITSDGMTAISETFDFLNARLKPFIVTKNESGHALIDAYKKVDQRALKLWARIADRWREQTTAVEFEGPSLRKDRRQA